MDFKARAGIAAALVIAAIILQLMGSGLALAAAFFAGCAAVWADRSLA